MKASRIFWGILFLVVGVLLLLDRLNVWYLDWSYIAKFWPVILVLWGISLLLGDRPVKWVVVGIVAIGVGALIFSLANFTWFGVSDFERTERYAQDLVRPYDSVIARAYLYVDAAAGSYAMEDTTGQLIEASTVSTLGEYSLEQETTGESTRLTLSLEGGRMKIPFVRIRNKVLLRLNSNPLWDMKFDAGAASLDLDLTPYKTENISVTAGASKIRMRLGDRLEESRMKLEAGASSLHIEVPEEAGCEITTDIGFSSKRFRGFEKTGENRYRTDNFDSASKRISIAIETGVSSDRVERY